MALEGAKFKATIVPDSYSAGSTQKIVAAASQTGAQQEPSLPGAWQDNRLHLGSAREDGGSEGSTEEPTAPPRQTAAILHL